MILESFWLNQEGLFIKTATQSSLLVTPKPNPPEGFSLWHTWESSELTPSNNLLKGMHYQAYRKLRSQWRDRLLGQKPQDCPLIKAYLLVVRKSLKVLDWDNAYGGLKPLLDCLSLPSLSNPDGLGWIMDDKPNVLVQIGIQQIQVAHKNETGTILYLYRGPYSL